MNGHPHALRDIDMIPDRHVEVGQWIRRGCCCNWNQIMGLKWLGDRQAVIIDKLDIDGNPVVVELAFISETMSNREMQLKIKNGHMAYSQFHEAMTAHFDNVWRIK